MPNRILKESICTSDSIDGLGWFEEVLYYRLIVNCDDFGRFDGRTAVIKNRLFPLKDNLTLKNVENAINKLARVGLISLYTTDGRPFLFLPTWNEHQSIRAKRSKYPDPEIICNQMQADEIKCPRNPIQSESNPNPNTNDSAEPRGDSAPVILLPLNDGSEYPVFVEQTEEWAKLYPAVDVMQELREMRGWLQSHPRQRKTKRGILAFVTRWLSKEQDKGGRSSRVSNAPSPASGYSNVSSGNREKDDMERMRRIMQEGKT